MTCTVEQRRTARRAAGVLRRFADVVGVDVLEPADNQHDRWAIRAVVRDDCIPSYVLRTAALEGMDGRALQPQGEHMVFVATA